MNAYALKCASLRTFQKTAWLHRWWQAAVLVPGLHLRHRTFAAAAAAAAVRRPRAPQPAGTAARSGTASWWAQLPTCLAVVEGTAAVPAAEAGETANPSLCPVIDLASVLLKRKADGRMCFSEQKLWLRRDAAAAAADAALRAAVMGRPPRG